jgi:tripeptidyl-peptidase-2
MIFDSNKQRVALGDIYPAAVKLPKGKYTVRVLLRHDRGDLLAKFKATALLIERTLDEPLSVKCHKSARGALVGNASFDKATLPLGHRWVRLRSSLRWFQGCTTAHAH